MAEVAPGVRVFSVSCQYCKRAAVHRKSSAHLYRGNDYGPVWECPGDCDAYVGCHPDGAPLGCLANKELRQAKMRAHAAFDPLWKNYTDVYPHSEKGAGKLRSVMRGRAYRWLAFHMGLSDARQCHIGMLDVAQCDRVIAIIQEQKPTPASVRAWAKQ